MKIFRVPMFPGVVTPFPWPLLVFFKMLIESRAQFRKFEVRKWFEQKKLSCMKRSKKERRKEELKNENRGKSVQKRKF